MKRLELGRGVFMASAVLLASVAGAATTVTTNASNEVTYDVPTGETYTENGSWDATIAKVTKTGGGTLELKAAHPNFTKKDFEIRAGYVKTAQKSNPVGTATVKVSKGAALWYAGESPGQTTKIFTEVDVEGDGPDGKGAFYRTGYSGGDDLIYTLKLTDGATIGGDKRFGVYVLNLNGHTLTNALTGSDTYMFLLCYVSNPGNIVQKNGSTTMQTVESWGTATAANTWTIDKSDAALCFYSGTRVFPWTIESLQNFKLTVNSTTDRGIATGPIKLHGKTMTVQSARVDNQPTALELRGDISGGSITKATDSMTLRLVDSDHDLTSFFGSFGPTVMTGGVHQVLARPWNSVSLMNGSSLALQDVGTVCATQAHVYIYSTAFSSNRKSSRLDVSGKTLWDEPFAYRSAGSSIIQIGGRRETADGHAGWGVLSVSDGAAVTNGFSLAPKGRGALYVRNGATTHSTQGFWLDVAGSYSSGSYRYGFLGVDNARHESFGGFRTSTTTNAEGHVVLHDGTLHLGNQSLHVGCAGYGNFYADNARITSGDSLPQVWLGETDAQKGGEGVFTLDNCTTAKVLRLVHQTHTNHLAQLNVNNGSYLRFYQVWARDKSSSRGPRAGGARSIFSVDGGILEDYSSWEYSKQLFADNPDSFVVHSGGLTLKVNKENYDIVSFPIEGPKAKSFKSISLPTDEAFLAKKFIGPVRLVIEGPGEGASAFIDFDTKTETLGGVVITSKGSGYDETTKVWAIPHESPTERYECAYELQDETGGDFTKEGEGYVYFDCTNTYRGATIVNGGYLYTRGDWALPSNTSVRVNNGSLLNLMSKEAKFSSIGGSGGYINGSKDKQLVIENFDVADGGRIIFNSDVDNVAITETGKMTVDAADLASNLVAGKELVLGANITFAPTATIEFKNIDKLDEEVRKYPILSVMNRYSISGAPTLVNGESLGGKWSFRANGKRLVLGFNSGSLLIVR